MSNPDTTRIFNYPEVTTPASDAKILLDSQTVGSKCIDANLFRCDLIDKTITQRGTFEASEDDADGFKKVVVDIPYTDVHVASGPIATFEGEDLPLKSLTASIVPVQAGSGDPSPTNVRPISGWTEEVISVVGKNFWNPNNVTSGYLDEHGVIQTLSGFQTLRYRKCKGGDDVTLSYYRTVSGERNGMRIAWYDANKNFIRRDGTLESLTVGLKETTATAPSNAVYVQASLYTQDASEIQLEIGTSASQYEPYAGTTTTIPFTDRQGQSVEVFGGSVEVVSGALSEQFVCEKLPFSNYLTKTDLTNVTRYTYALSNEIDATDYSTQKCNMATVDASYTSDTPHFYCGNMNLGARAYLFLPIGIEPSVDVDFYYKLATPTTFYTQPTSIKSLDGENNVSASTGDVDVEYQTVWVRPTE